MHVDEDDRRLLLQIARQALEARVRRAQVPPAGTGGLLDLACGVFVTIHHRGELRGCLGRLGEERPLGESVADLAAAVSDSDPRFRPVEPHELEEIDVEISVLTPERETSSVAHIEIGRHGLIIEQGACRGLLLPQVAVEQGWDVETFLGHACIKAALPPDAWRRGARILLFEAVVFGERSGHADA